MRLDRNSKGRGKYGLILRRKLDEFSEPGTDGFMHHASIDHAIKLLEHHGIIDWGATPETEFFVMRLKDRFASTALFAYAIGADAAGEHEYSEEINDLSKRSLNHANRKTPD